jgi:molybdopterin converting factor small subunit
LPAGSHVADLVGIVAERVAGVRSAPGLIAVNHTYVQADHELHDGDEVAFIPPVSGGC